MDFFVDDFASFRKLLLSECFVALADALEVVDRVEIDIRESGDCRFEVSRDGKIENQEVSATAFGQNLS